MKFMKKTSFVEVKVEENVVDLDSNPESSVILFLPKFKQGPQNSLTPVNIIQIDESLQVHVALKFDYSQAQTKPLEKEKRLVEQLKYSKSLLRELEVARKERVEILDELEKLQKTLKMVDDAACNEETMSCLGLVHKLRDKEIMVSKA